MELGIYFYFCTVLIVFGWMWKSVKECKRVKNIDKISQFYFLNNSNFSSSSFPYNELTHNKKI